MAKRKKINWRKLRGEYEAGASTRALAHAHRCSRSTICEHAKVEKWTRRAEKASPTSDAAGPALPSSGGDARAFLVAMMDHPDIDLRLRLDAAKSLLRLEPIGSFGKKARAAADADEAWEALRDRFGLGEWGNDLDVPADIRRGT
jgi:hypothetical protein